MYAFHLPVHPYNLRMVPENNKYVRVPGAGTL